MSQQEVLPYGDNDNPLTKPQGYEGMLYRFTGAEHIGFEKSADGTAVFLSTPHDSQTIAGFYERVFAVAVSADSSNVDDESVEAGSDLSTTVTMNIGPVGCMIVRNVDFRLSWLAPHQPFWDREAETAKVHLYQTGDGLDLRHRELITLIASEAMRPHLEPILRNY